ncbi:FKBP-type peptidyl-prolyl cis-trans isomerase [Candidatus Bathyarchaeota archaeon]|nr:FKBP-type peptidyl-prolyl cis-trans isomerase [Candidatus Bathyarchaeota archaeon]
MSEDKKPVEEKPVEEKTVDEKLEEPKTDEEKVPEVDLTESKTEEELTKIDEEKTPEELPSEVKEEAPELEPRIEGAVNNGDFVQVEMTGKVAETGEVFDTTSEEIAKEHGLYSEDRVYGQKLVVVNDGWVLKGLDKKLRGIKPGESTAIEIEAEDAFGERDANNIQLIPFRILRSKGVNPVIGSEIEIDGRNAVVRSIGAGRVQVDYNHPLAGRKIIYEVTVNKIIEDQYEKLKALINRRFVGIEAEKFIIQIAEKKIIIQIPDEIFFGENIQIAKRGLAIDIMKYFPEFEEVEFVEIIKKT